MKTRKKTKQKIEHKYTVIAKTGTKSENNEKWYKWHTSDLVKFTQFLDREYRDWKFFNVYANTGERKREQIANYTRFSRPINRTI